MITAVLQLLRPKQWAKNVFVLGPLVFSERFLYPEYIFKAAVAFVVFSFVASVLYIFNDICDRRADMQHPTKKYRPVASGAVSVPLAVGIMVGLGGISAVGVYMVPAILPMLGVYVGMILLYSVWLKHTAVVEMCIVASGFVLRTFVGGDAISAPHSNWMTITVFCLALFLITSKRRQELAHVGDTARTILRQYTVPLLDKFVTLSATATFVFYTLFVALNKPQLAPSVPFVLFGLMRYMMLLENKNIEDPTEAVIKDIPILLNAWLWGISILYFLA